MTNFTRTSGLLRPARHLLGWTFAVSLATLLLSAQRASAESQAAGAQPSSDQPAPLGLRVALGFSGGVNGSFLQKPKDEYYYANGTIIDSVYPGFGGAGGLIGAQLDLGWRYITLSTGYTESFDYAEGKADGFTVQISQRTAHIPLTVRFELPSKIASPSLFAGLNWVSPSEGEVETSEALISPYKGVKSSPYRAWTFGLGVDVMLTDVLRLPIRFYGILNPNSKDTLNDSLVENPLLGPSNIKGEWDWQAGITLGLSYDVYRR